MMIMVIGKSSVYRMGSALLVILFLLRFSRLGLSNFQNHWLRQYPAESLVAANLKHGDSAASDGNETFAEVSTGGNETDIKDQEKVNHSAMTSKQHASDEESSTTDQYNPQDINSTTSTPLIEATHLKSGVHFQAAVGVDFVANLTVSSLGQICVDFDIIGECETPYIRTRLVGSSLVHIHVARVSQSHLEGCTMIPIAGLYFLDAVLVHCTMDALNQALGPRQLKRRCPLKQNDDPTKHYSPFNFTLPPFPHRTLPSHMEKRNNFPESAWIYAPACSEHKTSAECAAYGSDSAVQPMPRFLPAKYQETAWLQRNGYSHWERDERLNSRYDHYVWLPVDMATGKVNYTAYHAMTHHTPSPPYIDQKRRNASTMRTMFVGDSHGRHLWQQTTQIYFNITNDRDGCFEIENSPIVDADSIFGGKRFDYDYLTMAMQWLRGQSKTFDQDKFIVTMGQWDASFFFGRPSAANGYIIGLNTVLSRLKELIKPEAEIFVTTVDQLPLGERMLGCGDWRVPPLIDAYNKRLWEQVSVDHSNPGPRAFRFTDHPNTYLLDTTDIMDPIWDSAIDWNHPCRNGMRPVALRILSLLYENEK